MNQVQIIGRLTRDPELRHTAKGTAVCSFSIAVNETLGDKEITTYVDCEAWSYTASTVSDCRKGDKLLVTGRLKTDSWEDKNTGQKRTKTLVNAQDVWFQKQKREPVTADEPRGQDEEVPF